MQKRERQPLGALGQNSSPLRTYKRRKKHAPVQDDLSLERLFAEPAPLETGPKAAADMVPADSDREDKENEDPGNGRRRVAATPKGKRGKQPAPLRGAGAARTPLADTTELVNAQSNMRGGDGGQPSWGLGSEAAFFADLDEQTLEEESERSQSPKSPSPRQMACSVESPPSELLPRIYPDLQVKYQEYVRSMPPQCTPMALPEFCKLIDKSRGWRRSLTRVERLGM